MNRLSTIAGGVALALLLAPPALGQEEVRFPTLNEDGATVFADRYPHAGERSRGIALLFHDQAAGSEEYAEIAPRLAALGFDAVAVELRTGSDLPGVRNRTFLNTRAYINTFDDGLPDAAGAVAWARGQQAGGPILLFGSGVSADMAIVIAADDPEEIAAVLAFSPPSLLVYADEAEAASRLTVPLFVTYGTTPRDERARVAKVTDAVPQELLTLHVPEVGVHGAPTLAEARNPAGWEENWSAVAAFLDRVAP